MMYRLLNSVFLCFILILSGCTTAPENCDPSIKDVSLFGKMSCDHSGGYREHIEEKEQQVANARAENEMFREVYDEIVQQQEVTRLSLQEMKEQQAALDQKLSQLLTQLKKRHATNQQMLQQVADLEQELNKRPPAKQVNPSPAELDARKQELKQLQQEISRLQLSLGYE